MAKRKKELKFPTFTNEQFIVPAVIAGAIYVYEFLQMMDFETKLAYVHRLDPVTSFNSEYSPLTYRLNPWPVVIPCLIFIFSVMTFLGLTDIIIIALSKKRLGQALFLLGQKLAFGVLEMWEWQKKD